jgi:hypothetical protein
MTSFIQSLQRAAITENVNSKSAAILKADIMCWWSSYRMANFLSRVAQCLVSHACALPLTFKHPVLHFDLHAIAIRSWIFVPQQRSLIILFRHRASFNFTPDLTELYSPSSSKLNHLHQPDGPDHRISLRLRLCCFWRRGWRSHFAWRV